MRIGNRFQQNGEITALERLYFAYRYFKINIKYYFDFYILNKYRDVPGHAYINKKISDSEYTELVQKIYGNKYVAAKYVGEAEQMKTKRWSAQVITQALKLPGGGNL